MSRRIERLLSAQAMTFDCHTAECFIVDMRYGVQSTQLKNASPGVLYTFIFRQDAKGGHRFPWPPQVQNAAPIDLRGGETSSQNFIAADGNTLLPMEPGARY